MKRYYLVDCALGELHLMAGDRLAARQHFWAAQAAAKAAPDRQWLDAKLAACDSKQSVQRLF
jgi:hypothetical protein